MLHDLWTATQALYPVLMFIAATTAAALTYLHHKEQR